MRVRSLWLTVLAVFTMVSFASAGTITAFLYADTAPNIYGSPNWTPWWDQAKADAAAGTFVNMRSGRHRGTTYFEPKEAIVYSTGDLGKRLHWIYWIPGVTKEELNGLFEVNNTFDWAGRQYVWGEIEYAGGVPDREWLRPTRWENYDKDGDGTTDGVIGTFGNAWWAEQRLDHPGPATPEDVEALAQEVLRNQTHWTGWIRYRQSVNDDWTYVQLRLQVVPEPGTMLLWLSGLAAPAVALLRRRK